MALRNTAKAEKQSAFDQIIMNYVWKTKQIKIESIAFWKTSKALISTRNAFWV